MSDDNLPLQTPPRYASPPSYTTQQSSSLQIKSIIRKKVSSYMGWQLAGSHSPLPKPIFTSKKSKPPPRQFLEYNSLQQFMEDQKMIVHLYKEKIDRNLDEFLYLYLKTLSLSIEYECVISQREVDHQSSVMIQAFLFVSWSLQQAGAQKAAFYLASIGVIFCELYKRLHAIGQFLLIMAKISRKLFRYRQSLILLKKALEYIWCKDITRTEQLNQSFHKWLSVNHPDQAELFIQKFQVTRLYSNQQSFASTRSHKNEAQLKILRDFLSQYLQLAKLGSDKIVYDICHLKQVSYSSEAIQRVKGLELQIYNEMSYNFLQLNKKEESKIFAEKYQSGYVQSEHSKIKTLSSELIDSVQRRVSGWHRISPKTFQLLFFVDIFQILRGNKAKFKNFNQQTILQSFKVSFDSCWQTFFRKEIFNYQIPLPLEIRKESFSKKKVDGRKFIVRQRSTSQAPKEKLPVLYNNVADKVEQTLIFNYRGIGISRIKLIDRLQRFMDVLKEKERLGILKRVRRMPILKHHSVSQFSAKMRYGQ